MKTRFKNRFKNSRKPGTRNDDGISESSQPPDATPRHTAGIGCRGKGERRRTSTKQNVGKSCNKKVRH